MSPWLSDLYLRSQTDQRLINLTRDGHARAFAVLTERYRGELVSAARRLVAPAEAEDAVQQTLLSAFAAIMRGTDVQHARGWLHAILRHAAARARAPLTAPLPPEGELVGPALAVQDARDDARELLAALDDLPERQREALIGSTVQGLSRSELAACLGVSEGAVRQLVHRARIALRSAVSGVVPYPLARWLAGAGADPGGTLAVAAMPSSAAGLVASGLVAKLGVIAAAGVVAVAGLAGGAKPRRALAPVHPAGRRPSLAATASRPGPRLVTATLSAAGSPGAGRRPAGRGGGPGPQAGVWRAAPGSAGGRHRSAGAGASDGSRGAPDSGGSGGSGGSPGSDGSGSSDGLGVVSGSGGSGSSGSSGSSGGSGGSGGSDDAVAAATGAGETATPSTTTSSAGDPTSGAAPAAEGATTTTTSTGSDTTSTGDPTSPVAGSPTVTTSSESRGDG